jgi:uncharacterized protein (TIGR02246 family)
MRDMQPPTADENIVSRIDDEQTIREIVAEQQHAWNAGDATWYAARFHADGTFTNVFGERYVGREAFRERHAAIFSTFAKGSTASFVVQRIHCPIPETAVVDIDCAVEGQATWPPGLSSGPTGVIRSSLLQVLVKQGGQWWIVGYHNVDVKAMPRRAPS